MQNCMFDTLMGVLPLVAKIPPPPIHNNYREGTLRKIYITPKRATKVELLVTINALNYICTSENKNSVDIYRCNNYIPWTLLSM